MSLTIDQQLDLLADRLPTIPSTRRYWFIRTETGYLYDAFKKNNIVGLLHNELSIEVLKEIQDKAAGNPRVYLDILKDEIIKGGMNKEPKIDKKTAARRAGQMFRFIYNISQGDIVLIPSYSSNFISIGRIVNHKVTPNEILIEEETTVNLTLAKQVEWIAHLSKYEIDPYLFRAIKQPQAISDIGKYSELVERAIKDFFVLPDESHLIINVQSENKIKAQEVFGFGNNLIFLVDDFAKFAGITIDTNDLEISLYLNSPGKIDLKSSVKKVTILACIILLLTGGGTKSKILGVELTTMGLPGLLEAWDKYKDHEQDREIKMQMFTQFKDSLKIKEPEDLLKLMKQVSSNKDLPK